MFYLGLIAITTIIFFFAQKCYEKWPFAFWPIAYLGIFILSFFAGVRGRLVGWDVRVYAIGTWTTIRSYIGDFWDGIDQVRREFLYYTINYLSLCISDSFAFALFLMSFITYAFVLHAMRRYMDVAPLWLTMLAFNIYFYIISLNLIAQGIAVAFILFFVKFLEQRRLLPLLVCIVISYFFHHTAAIAGVYFLLVYWAMGRDECELPKLFTLAAMAVAAALVLLSVIFSMLTDAFPDLMQYRAYTVGGKGSGWGHFVSVVDFALNAGVLFVVVLFLKLKQVTDMRFAYYLAFFALAGVASQLLGYYSFFATRMSYYFFLYEIPLFFVFVQKLRMTKKTKVLIQMCFLVGLLYFCVNNSMRLNVFGAYPYRSEILDIPK